VHPQASGLRVEQNERAGNFPEGAAEIHFLERDAIEGRGFGSYRIGRLPLGSGSRRAGQHYREDQ
jgi:hypothetical protein